MGRHCGACNLAHSDKPGPSCLTPLLNQPTHTNTLAHSLPTRLINCDSWVTLPLPSPLLKPRSHLGVAATCTCYLASTLISTAGAKETDLERLGAKTHQDLFSVTPFFLIKIYRFANTYIKIVAVVKSYLTVRA